MADLIAKMRVRTKVAGLVTLFGCAFAVAMAVQDNQGAGTFGVVWCLGTAVAGDRFFKFLFEDLKDRSRREPDGG